MQMEGTSWVPKLLVKAGSTMTGDQAAQGFNQSDIENLHMWRLHNFLVNKSKKILSAELHIREENNTRELFSYKAPPPW